ncbi:unnamed protein product, partial [Prorocentrum cordatum]
TACRTPPRPCAGRRRRTVPEVQRPVTSVRCLHLLKKHAGSRRPSSWREKVITRSVEEATYRLKELRKAIEAKATPAERQAEFERLARRESDCGSAAEGGSLGRFGRGKMQTPFEEASFALKVQELTASSRRTAGCTSSCAWSRPRAGSPGPALGRGTDRGPAVSDTFVLLLSLLSYNPRPSCSVLFLLALGARVRDLFCLRGGRRKEQSAAYSCFGGSCW